MTEYPDRSGFDFPPLDPPPPKAGEFKDEIDAQMSAELHRAISMMTNTTGPGEGRREVDGMRTVSFGQAFPGQRQMTEEERLLIDIDSLLRDISTKIDNLPMNIALAMRNN